VVASEKQHSESDYADCAEKAALVNQWSIDQQNALQRTLRKLVHLVQPHFGTMLLEKLVELDHIRSKSDPITPGSISLTSSSTLATGSSRTKPQAKRWDHRLSTESQARSNSTLKASSKINGPRDTTLPRP
jgi:hypothetical protein